MPVLDAKGLTKSLGARVLLAGVDVTILRGEKVGLVGDNGAGKSTLARILAGLNQPDTGEIHRRRETRVLYLEQEPTLPAGKSALELVSAELRDWNSLEDPVRLLSKLGIVALDQDVATMSGGERRRVALAQVLVAEPDLAILDEPTNHLDADTIEWLEGYLETSYPGALLLVTHDRWLLDRVVTRTLEISGGQLHSYDGGWAEYLLGRDERLRAEERAESNRRNFLRTEIEWLRRQPKARTGKQKARIGRAEAALATDAPNRAQELDFRASSQRLGGNILEARELTVSIGERRLVADLTFQLTRGSRVGIVGPSGAGKTTLLRTLLGLLEPTSGQVITGKNTKIAYLDQMRSDLDDTLTVYDAVTGGRPTVSVGEHEYSSYSYLERFRFRGEAVRQSVRALSGGERARLALARLLLTTANVLVLDEPTNDLDVMTLGALEELLLEFSGAAILVSHDRYFLDRVATSVLVLDGVGGTTHVQGGYSSYAEWRAATRKNRDAKVERPLATTAPAATARPKKLSYGERLEYDKLMPRIETLGQELEGLQVQLSDPALYAERRDEAAALEAVRVAKKAELEGLELRWLELEERRGG
jgi:ABC transport system ATP-binding/permease protein